MRQLFCLLILQLIVISCGSNNDDSSGDNLPQPEQAFDTEILTDQNDVIWGFDFINQNQIIFTERNGSMHILDSTSGNVTTITGVPDVAQGGEGGLLDLKLHPAFENNRQIFFCYSDGSSGSRSQSLGRAELQGNTLINFQRIFNSGSPNGASNHFGCRIQFQNNNSLFLTVGEQGDSQRAQNPSSLHGKILRMNSDGSSIQIWSNGHRNPQGLAVHPTTGELWSSEHGPSGGDEINIIEQNQNYGWPLVTTGQPEGDLGESAPGFVDPIISWSPSIAPSGITFYTGNVIPEWRGNLFVSTLRGRHLRRLTISNNHVTDEELLFESLGARIRNVRQGPDGFLYFSTDDGRLIKIVPKK